MQFADQIRGLRVEALAESEPRQETTSSPEINKLDPWWVIQASITALSRDIPFDNREKIEALLFDNILNSIKRRTDPEIIPQAIAYTIELMETRPELERVIVGIDNVLASLSDSEFAQLKNSLDENTKNAKTRNIKGLLNYTRRKRSIDDKLEKTFELIEDRSKLEEDTSIPDSTTILSPEEQTERGNEAQKRLRELEAAKNPRGRMNAAVRYADYVTENPTQHTVNNLIVMGVTNVNDMKGEKGAAIYLVEKTEDFLEKELDNFPFEYNSSFPVEDLERLLQKIEEAQSKGLLTKPVPAIEGYLRRVIELTPAPEMRKQSERLEREYTAFNDANNRYLRAQLPNVKNQARTILLNTLEELQDENLLLIALIDSLPKDDLLALEGIEGILERMSPERFAALKTQAALHGLDSEADVATQGIASFIEESPIPLPKMVEVLKHRLDPSVYKSPIPAFSVSHSPAVHRDLTEPQPTSGERRRRIRLTSDEADAMLRDVFT